MLAPELKTRFNKAKRSLFDKLYENLNPQQRMAVYSVNGPLLVLAGAGSGKTTVLVKRIAHLVKYGNAYFDSKIPDFVTQDDIEMLEYAINEDEEYVSKLLTKYSVETCPPWSVLTITFTNKAANEMKTRLSKMVDGEAGNEVWAGTFHSTCLKILRRFGEYAGLQNNFTIYDTDDSKKLITSCIKKLNYDEKMYPAKEVMNVISRAKDSMISVEQFEIDNTKDFKLSKIAKIYREYQDQMKLANAVDFDDIIYKTVCLLRDNEEVRNYYQRRFKYICIDEYQDTNRAQLELAILLSGYYRNLMVVGDEDQSIYKFRGATIDNILTFDKTFPDAKVIKLEQNYRSTCNILNAANAIIKNNNGRIGKNLWSALGEGEKIVVRNLTNQLDEGKYITNVISTAMINDNMQYKDFAILYRMNAQSNALEQVFARSGIPYRILGGTRFYERKEIKDVLAYLCLICNPNDDVRLERVINEPKRKIGATTVNAIKDIASIEGCSMFEVMKNAKNHVALSKAADKLGDFCFLIEELAECSKNMPLNQLFEEVIERTGYKAMLLSMGITEIDRLENVQELVSNAVEYMEAEPEGDLRGFLENVALIADVDNYDTDSDAVVMMTIHSAKGLEFPVVFLVGMEEGIFPGIQSSYSPDDLEEERRLAYVAITRAKRKLYMTNVHERMIFGHSQYNRISRFIEEIPKDFVDMGLTYAEKRAQMRENMQKAAQNNAPKRPTLPPKKVVSQSAQSDIFAGDSVIHPMFGRGDVLSVTPMGNDKLYEIAFDRVGTKKLMGSYVKLKKG